ncbi:MAG: teichoic acid biosynthesis protein B [Prevotella sp.]|nr:teichoic acid biosynthesis protein B [Prevotella sp.]
MKKKILLMMLAIATISIAPATAQTEKKPQKEKFGQRLSRLAKKTVNEIEKTANELGDAIGFEDRVDPSKRADSVKINGTWYMPLYTVNLYKGNDSDFFRETCRQAFEAKFPNVKIETVVIPQQDWLTDALKESGRVVGYVQTLYCFVVGKDGADGYVNARFAFQRQKEVGQQYQIIRARWPIWERTDAIPMASYEKLKEK